MTTMWKPDVCIYHSPCDDGFAAAWAVYRRWGDTVEYIPGIYGRPAPDVAGKRVLIVDFSFKRDVLAAMGDVADSIVVLDHHKTAQAELAEWSGWTPQQIADFDPRAIPTARLVGEGRSIAAAFDMGRSGARLSWEFCFPSSPAPWLIRYVEDRDLWRFQYEETKAFSLWLRSHPMDFHTWSRIHEQLQDDGDRAAILSQSTAIQVFYDRKIAELVREVRMVTIGGYLVPAVNCSWAFASDVAHALLETHPLAPFAASYYDRGDGRRSYSLRSTDDRHDVSEVAKAHGGGGHRNAAGFEVAIP